MGISLEKIESPIFKCNACLGGNDVIKLKYGKNENQTSSVRLCKDCRALVVKLFVEQIEREVLENGN